MTKPILIATIMRPEGETGVQTHFRAFMEYLGNESRPCELITPYCAPLWQVYPTFALRKLLKGEVSVWWYRYWHACFLRQALQHRLQSESECVIYAQCPLSSEAALSARVSDAQRVIMVTHFNVSQADEWAGKGLIADDGKLYRSIQHFEANVLPKLDGLVFVSEFMHRALLERIPAIAKVASAIVPNFLPDPELPASNAPLSDNTVDLGREHSSPEGKCGERENSQLTPSRTSPLLLEKDLLPQADLINIGTLEARKNQQYLLEIIAALREQGNPLTLTLVGDGPDKSILEDKARALKIDNLVRFAGFLSQAANQIVLHRAYIHVATQESFGITLIEAMSRSRPVFAAPVGGIPEVLGNSLAGLALPLNDASAAARIVADALNNQAWMVSAGIAARERFITEYASDVVAKRLLMFLDDA